MTAWRDDPEPDLEESWDDEDASADDDTIPCPVCGREVYDDAPQCPGCGHYLSAGDRLGPGKPRWILVTAIVCLALVAWWALTTF